MSETRRELMKMLADYGQIGITFTASIFIGYGIGYYLDNKVLAGRWSPWLTFIFLFLGIAAGFKNLFDLVKQTNREIKNKESAPDKPRKKG